MSVTFRQTVYIKCCCIQGHCFQCLCKIGLHLESLCGVMIRHSGGALCSDSGVRMKTVYLKANYISLRSMKPLYLNSGAYSFTAFAGVPAMELRFTEVISTFFFTAVMSSSTMLCHPGVEFM